MLIHPPHSRFNLTPFQTQWVKDTEKKEGFSSWVGIEINPLEAERKQGPIVIPYYTTDGKLHAARLGTKRVLHEVTA